MKQPKLLIIRGLPGSGKTYLAQQLVHQFEPNMVVQLDPDATDYDSQEYLDHVSRATAEGVDPRLHAYRFLRAQAYDGIEAGKVIIWNQPFTNLEIFHKMTAGLQAYAVEHDAELSIYVVEVMIDPKVAADRVVQRKLQGGHGPSEATFQRFIGDYQTFASEGYNTVVVSGTDDAALSITKIMSTFPSI